MKAQHYMCLDIWGKPGGPQVIWSQAPFPTVLWVRSASQETFLMVGPGTVPASPWGMGFSCLPACRIIQTSQSYPPARNSPSGYYKFCFPWPHIECTVQCAVSSPHSLPYRLWVHVANSFVNLICPVPRCQVFKHLILFREEDPSPIKAMNRRISGQRLRPHHLQQNVSLGDRRMGIGALLSNATISS